jgi:cytochrome c553
MEGRRAQLIRWRTADLMLLARAGLRHDGQAVNTTPALRTLRAFLFAAAMPLALSAVPAAAAPPTNEDTMAQRMVACTVCHGPAGRAAADGYYPRIAGKPAGYLYHQLLNFRDGRRHYGPMTRMVDLLSDDYLREIAGYFAALDLPYPAPARSTATAQQLQRGQQLVQQGDGARGVPACAQCHGAALTGVAPHVPGLLGLPRDYLNSQLGAWRTGERRAHAPDCMADIARRLPDEDVAAVSGWLAAQALPAQPKAVAAAPAWPAQVPPMPCGSAPDLGAAR